MVSSGQNLPVGFKIQILSSVQTQAMLAPVYSGISKLLSQHLACTEQLHVQAQTESKRTWE